MNKKEIKTREYLIKSMPVMLKKGYHGTSIKDLTDELGIPKGSFYNYYESKVDYTIKALELFYEYLDTNYFYILSSNELPAAERILKLFDNKVKDIINGKIKYGCFIGKLSLELSWTDEIITPVVNNLHERMKDRIYQCLLENNNKDIEKIDYISNIIMYCWQGALMRYMTSNDIRHLNNFKVNLEDLLSN